MSSSDLLCMQHLSESWCFKAVHSDLINDACCVGMQFLQVLSLQVHTLVKTHHRDVAMDADNKCTTRYIGYTTVKLPNACSCVQW